MLVKERLSIGQWVPPWLRYQHQTRYAFAAARGAGLAVLDAACGNGYGTATISRGGSGRAIGVDVSLEALIDGRLVHTAPAMHTLAASATALPFPDQSFDLFVSFETIEHIEDDASYVSEARRVVRPGGTFLCSTPNRLVLNPGRSLSERPFNPFHIREYAPDDLLRVLGTRFSAIELYGQSAYAPAYVALLTAIGRRLPMLAVRLHQLRKVAGIPLERPGRHEPRPWSSALGQPEVLLAVCRAT
jgi:SAM-dependent methyltransferase